MSKLPKLISTLSLLILMSCTVTGAGSFRVGMTNSNFLEVGTTVDGDKVGKEASVKVDQTILDAILPSRPSGDDTANSSTPK